ncbi:MAG: hypothetical protein ACRDU0_20245, partial [Mycobacterium sp.]
ERAMGCPASFSDPVDQVLVQLGGGTTWLGTAQPPTRVADDPLGAGVVEAEAAGADAVAAPAASVATTVAALITRRVRPGQAKGTLGLTVALGLGWFDPRGPIRQG